MPQAAFILLEVFCDIGAGRKEASPTCDAQKLYPDQDLCVGAT